MILTEFDEREDAVINPSDFVSKVKDMPEIGVTCFSEVLINRVVEVFQPDIVTYMSSANGKLPVYKICYKGVDLAFFMSRVGAPACAASYEEMMEMGLEKLIMFGTCGALQKEIQDLAILIPTSAIRDEGTSYHYIKAGDEIALNEAYKDIFIDILHNHNYSYTCGKTWTTDAIYRETQAKVQTRKNQGAICVEMECAAMAAVAQFRKKDFFQFLYAADNLDNATWDQRSLDCAQNLDQKEQIALLAFELAIKMNEETITCSR